MILAFIHPDASWQALRETWDTTEHDILICTHQKVGTHLTKKFIVEILQKPACSMPVIPPRTATSERAPCPGSEVTASQGGTEAFLDFLERTQGQPWSSTRTPTSISCRFAASIRRPNWS